MDPNECLHEQLLLAREITEVEQPRPADVERLAEMAIALDEWIMKGGFIPERWTAPKAASTPALPPICAACREPIQPGAPRSEAKDGSLFHRRCWKNT